MLIFRLLFDDEKAKGNQMISPDQNFEFSGEVDFSFDLLY